jgi:hypothetical protein
MSCRSAGERRRAHLLSLQSASAEDHEADRQGDQADQRRTREKAALARGRDRAMTMPGASSGKRPAALATMGAMLASPCPMPATPIIAGAGSPASSATPRLDRQSRCLLNARIRSGHDD